jgi:hypothetical protein
MPIVVCEGEGSTPATRKARKTSSAAPIDQVQATATEHSATVCWTCRGRSRPVRVLRSTQGFPSGPRDDESGDWCAELAGAQVRGRFTDQGLEPARPYFYSLFVPRGTGWFEPVYVKLWTIPDREAEVHGGRPRTAGLGARDVAVAALLPAAFVIAYVVLMLARTGPGYRPAAAVTIALVAAWRSVEDPEYELAYFLRWLALPAVASALVVAAILSFRVIDRLVAGGALTGGVTVEPGPDLLIVVVAPLAMIGTWLSVTYTMPGTRHADPVERLLVLIGPPLAALISPDLALLALAGAGVALCMDRRRNARGPRAGRLAVARAARRAGRSGSDERRERLMFWLLLGLWVLNVCDLVLTTQGIQTGHMREANGVMRLLLHQGLVPTLGFKLGVVTIGVVVLWRLRRHHVTFAAVAVLTTTYSLIVLYQALWWIGLV